jgi:hypothetical protein
MHSSEGISTKKSSDLSIPTEEKVGKFMFRPILWIRKADKYEILRKTTAIVLAVLLSATILGLFIVIPGIIEWDRQANVKSKTNPVEDIIKKQISVKNTIAKNLYNFNNSQVSGQINGIYITTNETNLSETSRLLIDHPQPSADTQKIHIGCATWHNFDIMCARKSNYGLIIDFNPKNAEFIQKTVEIIKTSKCRAFFKDAMIAYLNSLKGKERDLFFHADQKGLPTERIEKEFSRQGSWLETEEKYLFIKELVTDDRIISITENITNCEKFSKIRQFLDSNKIFINTLYLSNICNFMKTANDKESFAKSIKYLLNKDTIFISCPKIKTLNSAKLTILHQQTLLGNEVLAQSFDNSQLFEKLIF